jgi:hypothetical protein
MLRRLILCMGAIALLLPVGVVGCNTTEPVIWSWPHNKRRLTTVLDGFHEMHMEVDRVIFDMEEYPIEADY